MWCVCLLAKGNIAHWKEVFNVVEKLARKHEINKQSLILMRAKVLFSYLEMLAPEKKVTIQIISSKRTQENEFVSYKLTEKVSPAFYHEELKKWRAEMAAIFISRRSMFEHHNFDERRIWRNLGLHMIHINSIIELEMLIPLGWVYVFTAICRLDLWYLMSN